MDYQIDFETLKKDLINYYGTAAFTASPLAFIELEKVKQANEEELLAIAINNHFDLNKYVYKIKSR